MKVYYDRSFLMRKAVSWQAVFAKAETLSRRLGSKQLCRSFDLLHVAISAASAVRRFATLDTDQAHFARAAGFNVIELPEA